MPGHKSASSSGVDNSRPLALHSAFPKFFKEVIFKHLRFHFRPMLSPDQHGFYHGRSVESETNLVTSLEAAKPTAGFGGQVHVINFDGF